MESNDINFIYIFFASKKVFFYFDKFSTFFRTYLTFSYILQVDPSPPLQEKKDQIIFSLYKIRSRRFGIEWDEIFLHPKKFFFGLRNYILLKLFPCALLNTRPRSLGFWKTRSTQAHWVRMVSVKDRLKKVCLIGLQIIWNVF